MQKNRLLACRCLSCHQQLQNLLSANFWVNNFFTNVHYRDANACCRNDAARW